MVIILVCVLSEDYTWRYMIRRDIRLFPGQAVKALSGAVNGDSQQIGFFLRPIDDQVDIPDLVDVQQRGGLVQFKNVLLVTHHTENKQ